MCNRFHLKFLYRYLVFLIFLIGGQISESQTIYQGNLYPYNKYQLNPAYAGSEGYMSVILSYRNASSVMQGTPKQLMFGLHLPVLNRMGLGGRVESQTEGLFNFFTGFIDYSYNVDFSYNQSLRFGISAGIRSSQLDNSKIIATDPSAIVEIASKYFLGTVFESSAGIVYQWKNLEINFSVPRLFGTSKEFNSNFATWLSYRINTLDEKLILIPNVYILYKPGTPLVYDINLIANFQEKFMLGAGYRNRPGIVLSTGVSFANIKLNYAAEISAEKYANIFNTIHEVSVTYQFKKVIKLPADSLYNSTLDLIVNNDSINSDSLIVNDFTSNSLLNDSIAHISDLDTTTANLTDNNLNTKQDSVMNVVKDNVNPIDEGPEYDIVKVGNGFFILKPRDKSSGPITENQVDSLLKTGIFYENNDVNVVYMVDSGKIINKSGKSDYFHENYYTVRVFINSQSDILLKNCELAEQLRVEKSTTGKINYYYGKFSKKSSAEQARNYLRKKGLKNSEVLKVSVYR